MKGLYILMTVLCGFLAIYGEGKYLVRVKRGDHEASTEAQYECTKACGGAKENLVCATPVCPSLWDCCKNGVTSVVFKNEDLNQAQCCNVLTKHLNKEYFRHHEVNREIEGRD